MTRLRRTWPGLRGPLRPAPDCTTCGGTQVTVARPVFVELAAGIESCARVTRATVCLTCEPPA